MVVANQISFFTFLQKKDNCSLSLYGYDPYYPLPSCTVAKAYLCQSLKDISPCSLDFVTALDVLEHIEDDNEALQQMRRLLKPNGKVLITAPAYQWCYSEHDIAIGHHRRYTKASIHNLFQHNGFTVVHFTYFFSFLIPVGVVRQCYLRMRKRWNKTNQLNVPIDPLGMFSTLAKLEFKMLLKTDFSLPFGYFLFVVASKNL